MLEARAAEFKKLDEIDRDYMRSYTTDTQANQKGSSKSLLSGLAYYAVLIGIVAILFISQGGGKSGVPNNILGFSAMRVLTASMQDVIPKDSLVVTKQVNPMSLTIGDDITFLVSEDTTVTHRIVGIHENYMNTGERGFETQGTMNRNPDKEIVLAGNLVGKVIYHNLFIGKTGLIIRENILWIMIFAALSIGLSVVLRTATGGGRKTPVRKERNK